MSLISVAVACCAIFGMSHRGDAELSATDSMKDLTIAELKANAAFAQAPKWELQQYWLPEKEAGFTPATVRFFREGDDLVIYGELEDVSIDNTSGPWNEFVYKFGDTLEYFIEFPDQSGYLELHVGSKGQRMQLRFPEDGIAGLKSRGIPLTDCLVQDEELFQVQVEVDQDNNQWRVLGRVPFRSLKITETDKPLPDIRISISRYDYTQGQEKPVISSTSPHEAPSFHRRHEWRVLKLSELPEIVKN